MLFDEFSIKEVRKYNLAFKFSYRKYGNIEPILLWLKVFNLSKIEFSKNIIYKSKNYLIIKVLM